MNFLRETPLPEPPTTTRNLAEELFRNFWRLCELWLAENPDQSDCAHFNRTASIRGISPHTTDNDNSSINPATSYRVLATVLHLIIFVLGVAGNSVLIIVARRTLRLRRPTYCYLTSLAYADLIVLFSAIPEAIVSHHIGVRWVFGQTGCSLLVFSNFLGINAGSLSILAFTVERYIAVLKPILAQKVCTVERATKIIVVLWAVSILYCLPWLGLTEVKADKNDSSIELCDFRLSSTQYTYFFVADLILFYIVPLLCALIVYARIAHKLGALPKLVPKSTHRRKSTKGDTEVSTMNGGETKTALRQNSNSSMEISNTHLRKSVKRNPKQSRTQALHVLMVVVIIFAICWLPYRGLLVYNSFLDQGWLNIWYLLFAKTLIYVNSAINPFLYNFMSSAFHDAVVQLFRPRKRTRNIHASVSI